LSVAQISWIFISTIFSLGPKALQARPRFDQSPVHREMIIAHHRFIFQLSNFSSFHHRGRFEFRFLVEFLSPRSIGPKSNRTVFAFSIELKAIRNGHQRGAAPVRKNELLAKNEIKESNRKKDNE
jgi:hypothetical protein